MQLASVSKLLTCSAVAAVSVVGGLAVTMLLTQGNLEALR